jgi:hypothetical protein
MGARYLVPSVPFWCVLAGGLALPDAGAPPAPGRRRRLIVRAGWAIGSAGALYAAFLMLVGTAVKPEVPVGERHPFGHYLLPAFARGRLAISTQSIDSVVAPPRSPVRAWNLGQRAGLDGLASLAPLGAVWIGCGAWLVATVRLRERAGSGTLQA